MKPTHIAQALLLIGAINLGILIHADCFDCPPTYSESIGEWENYMPNDTVSDFMAVECEMIIELLNDTLKNPEEAIILDVFERAAAQGKLSVYLDYLANVKPVAGDEKNVISWIYYKIDENYAFRTTTFISIYKEWLGIELPDYSEKGRPVTYGDLSDAVLSDEQMTAEGYALWFAPTKYWIRHFPIYRKPREEMPLELQKFLIKRLSQEFTLQGKYRMSDLQQMEEARIKFGLDSSQVFQYH
ncbi:MAG: hypothetical protein RIC35_09600 [Marinoscillum sp.]